MNILCDIDEVLCSNNIKIQYSLFNNKIEKLNDDEWYYLPYTDFCYKFFNFLKKKKIYQLDFVTERDKKLITHTDIWITFLLEKMNDYFNYDFKYNKLLFIDNFDRILLLKENWYDMYIEDNIVACNMAELNKNILKNKDIKIKNIKINNIYNII